MDEINTAAPQPKLERFEFHGTGSEYFRIWIVNLALSVATVGIYSAWAKVRRLKYLYGSTQLAGHAFDYHGQPLVILKGRLIGVTVLIAYTLAVQFLPALGLLVMMAILIFIPWVVTRARMFQLRMTSYRGVRFDFEPDERGAAKAVLLAPIASFFSLGFAMPWATRLRYRWLINNSAYGRTYFALDIGLKPYVKAVLAVLPFALLALLVFVGLSAAALALLGVTSEGDPAATPTPEAVRMQLLAMAVVVYPPVFLVVQCALAVWHRFVLNATLPATTLGPVRLHCKLSARRLAWIYVSNLLGIILTIGLFAPWAKVRSTRYMLESMGYVATGPIEEFHATESERTSAVGEELGELMDVDLGL